MRLFGGIVSVLPDVDLTYGLPAGKESPGPRHVCAVDREAPDAVGSRRFELCLPARFACVIDEIHLAHRRTLTVNDLVGLPVDRSGLCSCRELVNDRLVVARRSRRPVGTR